MMKLIAPDYYTEFKCIADRCKHSCCIGWVIDVDDDTLEYYHTIEGELGERLKKGIDESGETAHFILGEGERCPFLNQTGLCDLITELGEESLCQICTDHPRFRTYTADSLHLGLGLCCEAACRLVLTSPVAFIDLKTGEAVAVDTRLPACTDTRTPAEWASFYRGLERLDPAWDAYLDRLAACEAWSAAPADECLSAYFAFRYPEHRRFGAHAVRLLQTLCADTQLEETCDICRLYSAEIEYSDCNMTAIEKAAED